MNEVINVDFWNSKTHDNIWDISDISSSQIVYLLDPKIEKIQSQVASLFWKSKVDIKKINIDAEWNITFYISGKIYKYCWCIKNWEFNIDSEVFKKKIVDYQINNNISFYYEDITLMYKEWDCIRFYTSDKQIKVIYLWEETVETILKSL